MAFNIVFVEPEIPPNTGNVARTCAATGTKLHLIEPMGFSVDEKEVRRAGLDYWPFVDLRIYSGLEAFLEEHAGRPMYFVSTKGEKRYTEIEYEDEAMFLFGKETAGLPKDLLEKNKERTIRIPMGSDERLRSLNLANSASIVLYEALRQHGFAGLV